MAVSKMRQAGIVTARLDALVLLEDQLCHDRALLLAHPDTQLSVTDIDVLNNQLQRRLHHEPLAYIRGKAEFYGREFQVDKRVLVPRPESEAMIELLLWLTRQGDLTALSLGDIGSGSGCLGITAALELRLAKLSFHDSDPATLEVAKVNANRYGIRGQFIASDLLGSRSYDILLANLPYVPDDYPINQAASYEPALALFSGPDGLNHYRRLFEAGGQAKYIFTESLPSQHAGLNVIADKAGYQLSKRDDFIQLFTSRSAPPRR